jgi:hypothetical protein
MRLRSGAEFAPYYLKRTAHPRAPPDNPIATSVSVEHLLQDAVALEDSRFEHGEDDSEGLGVTSRPSTPVTEVESEDSSSAEETAQPRSSSGMQSRAKRRRNASANKRRAKKRQRLASAGHQPLTYAANPSTVMHHAEEQEPLLVSADAEGFPASRSGSWVGLRNKGVKKVPWTLPELLEKNFTIIEWDGW